MFPRGLMVLGLPQLLAWNPSDKDASVSLSNGNKTASLTGAGPTAPGVRSLALASGKVYVEVHVDADHSSGDVSVGVANSSAALTGTSFVGGDGNAIGWRDAGAVLKGGANQGTIASYGAGDYLGIAYDSAAAKVWFSKNGVWQSGDPAAGSGGFACSLGSPVFIQFQGPTGQTPPDAASLSSAYFYPPPSGFAPS